ncbi:MAG: hypothetical protein CL610_09940 [Anaerolineaceae bacterium]|nr:hypothetical protein [Anaerolineaceae bacterium]
MLGCAGINGYMPDKRVIEYHLSRLHDRSPAARIKAIRELGLLGDPATLEPLQVIFKNDPDAEVRKAAQDAGRAIFLKQREQSSAS